MNTVRYHALINGRVQGVGYRYYCQANAKNFSLSGWVKNKSDGGVELEVQGGSVDVTSFLSTLEQGPPCAHVNKVAVNQIEVQVNVSSFVIRY